MSNMRDHYKTVARCVRHTAQGTALPNEQVGYGDAMRLLGNAAEDVLELMLEAERLRKEVARLKVENHALQVEVRNLEVKLEDYEVWS